MRKLAIVCVAAALSWAGCMGYGGGAKLGEEAPAMVLPNLEGEPVDLADYIGSRVVVLDFWASWCGPCRQAMPHVEAVAGEYEDRPVTFFAVNQGEDRQTVQAFLEQSGLELHVLLDREGALGEAYGVRGIPHLAVIGPDGVVRAEYVGFAQSTASQLRSEIDAALAGMSAGDGEEPAAS